MFLDPGIAQLAERAIDNREVVGSTPTPWTILERASPSGKGTRLPSWHCVGSNPTALSNSLRSESRSFSL